MWRCPYSKSSLVILQYNASVFDLNIVVCVVFDLNIVVFIVIYVSYERQGCAGSYISILFETLLTWIDSKGLIFCILDYLFLFDGL